MVHVTNTLSSLSVFARYLDAHNQGANPLHEFNTSSLERSLSLLCHCRAQPTTGAGITNDAAVGIFAEHGAREKAVSRVKTCPVC